MGGAGEMGGRPVKLRPPSKNLEVTCVRSLRGSAAVAGEEANGRAGETSESLQSPNHHTTPDVLAIPVTFNDTPSLK